MKKQTSQTKRELTRAELRSQLEAAKLKSARLQDLAQKTAESNSELESKVEILTVNIDQSRKMSNALSAQILSYQQDNKELMAKIKDLEKKLSTEQAHYNAECERRNKDVRTIAELEEAISSEQKVSNQLRCDIEHNKTSHNAKVDKIYSRNLWQRIFNTKIEDGNKN